MLNYCPMFTKKLDTATRSVVAVLSSETVDSYGEIVDQASWKLDRFLKNPVVLRMHSFNDVIGHAEDVKLVDGALEARIVFATTSLANDVFTLFRDGAMRAFSVGFRPGSSSSEQVNGRKVIRLLDCELLEVSAVSVPANPDAIVKHKDLGLFPNVSAAAPVTPTSEFMAEVSRLTSLTAGQRDDDAVDRVVGRAFDEQAAQGARRDALANERRDVGTAASRDVLEFCMRGVNDVRLDSQSRSTAPAAEPVSRNPSGDLVRLAMQDLPDFDGPEAA